MTDPAVAREARLSPLDEVIAECEENAQTADPFLAVIFADAAVYLRRLKTAEDALDMLWAHYLLPISDEQKAQVLAAIRPNPERQP